MTKALASAEGPRVDHLTTRARTDRAGQGGPGEGAAFRPRRVGSGRRPSRSRRPARRRRRTRVPDLVPIRHGRMAASPFAFYRGAANVLAADLAAVPRTGLNVQLCGDAHLANFGGFASPERTLVFDINDFDETQPGPFEWDVKRLAASLEIAARSRGFDRQDARRASCADSVRSYREAMRTLRRRCATSTSGTPSSASTTSSALGRRARRRQRSPTSNDGGQGRVEGPAQGQGQADPPGRRRAAVPQRSAPAGAGRRALHRRRPRPCIEQAIHEALRSYRRTPPGRPPPPARELPLRRAGPQGGRRRQRRHPLLGRAHARPRQQRSAVPAGQGGRGLGARAVPGPERSSPTTASGSSRASG